MRRLVPVLSTVVALGATLLVTAPAAQAATRSYADARRDAPGSNDIVRTTATNGARIGVQVRHRDLKRSVADIQLRVRTSTGAEWTVYGVFDGSRGQVFDEDFREQSCPGVRVSRSLAKDRTALSVPRSCLGSPTGRVKVRPRVQWSADGRKGDWSINRGDHWTSWVPR